MSSGDIPVGFRIVDILADNTFKNEKQKALLENCAAKPIAVRMPLDKTREKSDSGENISPFSGRKLYIFLSCYSFVSLPTK